MKTQTVVNSGYLWPLLPQALKFHAYFTALNRRAQEKRVVRTREVSPTIRFVPNTGVHTSAEEELLFATNPLIMTDEIYKDSNCLTIIAWSSLPDDLLFRQSFQIFWLPLAWFLWSLISLQIRSDPVKKLQCPLSTVRQIKRDQTSCLHA